MERFLSLSSGPLASVGITIKAETHTLLFSRGSNFWASWVTSVLTVLFILQTVYNSPLVKTTACFFMFLHQLKGTVNILLLTFKRNSELQKWFSHEQTASSRNDQKPFLASIPWRWGQINSPPNSLLGKTDPLLLGPNWSRCFENRIDTPLSILFRWPCMARKTLNSLSIQTSFKSSSPN